MKRNEMEKIVINKYDSLLNKSFINNLKKSSANRYSIGFNIDNNDDNNKELLEQISLSMKATLESVILEEFSKIKHNLFLNGENLKLDYLFKGLENFLKGEDNKNMCIMTPWKFEIKIKEYIRDHDKYKYIKIITYQELNDFEHNIFCFNKNNVIIDQDDFEFKINKKYQFICYKRMVCKILNDKTFFKVGVY